MKRSVKVILKGEGLTSFKFQYNYKKDHFRLEMMKEWDPDLDFSKYNKEFYIQSLMTDNVVYFTTEQVEALFAKYGLADYLEDIKTLIRKGRHFGIEGYYHEGYDILFMSNQHSRKLGINNKLHAGLTGGIRRHNKDEEELDIIIDGLNLGRGMSFKNVAGRLYVGGTKQTVTMDPIDLENLQHVGFLGFCIDRCRTTTGPDMNFPTALADVENEHFSMQFTSGPKSPLGETGIPTAYGVYKTLKQAVKFTEGTESLDGKSATVVGLGAVGWYMAENLLNEKVKLYVADLNPARAEQFKAEHEGDITCIPLEGAYFNECDIVSPCAIGGILSEETIPKLKCKYVWGSSNNGLKASSTEEEIALAEMLKARGIVFQVEWWHNTAGVICGHHEYMYGKNATQEALYADIDSKLPGSTYMNLKQADELGITPTENAYRICNEVIYGDLTFEDL